jgi:hypothetical protein
MLVVAILALSIAALLLGLQMLLRRRRPQSSQELR